MYFRERASACLPGLPLCNYWINGANVTFAIAYNAYLRFRTRFEGDHLATISRPLRTSLMGVFYISIIKQSVTIPSFALFSIYVDKAWWVIWFLYRQAFAFCESRTLRDSIGLIASERAQYLSSHPIVV